MRYNLDIMSWEVLRAKCIFTESEFDVLLLYIRGYTARQIAIERNTSVRTSESHIQIIKEKVYARNRMEVMRWAEQSKLLYFWL